MVVSAFFDIGDVEDTTWDDDLLAPFEYGKVETRVWSDFHTPAIRPLHTAPAPAAAFPAPAPAHHCSRSPSASRSLLLSPRRHAPCTCTRPPLRAPPLPPARPSPASAPYICTRFHIQRRPSTFEPSRYKDDTREIIVSDHLERTVPSLPNFMGVRIAVTVVEAESGGIRFAAQRLGFRINQLIHPLFTPLNTQGSCRQDRNR
ncbi:hypothetical protein DFH08DRAFT_1090366 [Mycena albidolilacea]|uniref:Uncharacterized protein n=1 Tax=Mycena albidolilacea TaxID=1033008 RepID=A0AAD7E6R5_9AGAR|nr:hypothetical protein DFH08DRAFT_1090366 [Mycena albidolilacea]